MRSFCLLVGLALASLPVVAIGAETPPKTFHAGWYLDGPYYVERFLYYPRETPAHYLVRDNFMPGDGIQIDLFSAGGKANIQGLMIRNESDQAANVLLSGCSIIQTHKDGYWPLVKVDMPAADPMHVEIPPHQFVAADLSDGNSKLPAVYAALPKFGERNFALCDKITVTHPPP